MQFSAQPRDIQSTAAWLKGMFSRFDEDISLLHRVEPFWNPCVKCSCGHCCWQESYFFSGTVGNPFAAIEWWIALEHVRDTFTVGDRKQLSLNMLSKRKACVFLFGNQCKVYPLRSWICRIHPYTISFYPGNTSPQGEVAVPSCPKYASAFDIKVNQLRALRPRITGRGADRRLVQLQLPKHKPIWFIDATGFTFEYESYLADSLTGSAGTPWEDLLSLAEVAGKEQGDLFKQYLQKTLQPG